jgi:hypothetical protein
MKKFFSKKNGQQLGIIALMVLFFPLSVSAQTLTIAPSTQSVPVAGTRTFDIVVQDPGANSGVSMRMTINLAVLRFTNFVEDNDFTLSTGCADGSEFFDDDEICFDGAAGGAFTDGQVLATVTVRGIANGTQAMTFGAGTEFSDGVDTTAFTGNVGTYTITDAILPDTGLIDEQPLLFGGLLLLGLAILVNRTPFMREYVYLFLNQQQKAEKIKLDDQKAFKRKITKFSEERDAFEASFAAGETEGKD